METETGHVQENRYDAEGLRFELLENGRRTGFVYHNGELLHEKGDDNQNHTSYHLGTGMDVFQRKQDTFYYHRDEQLSMALITDSDGGIQNSYQYDAFGAEAEATEQLHNRIRYTGQQYDDVTGQYYLRARYYNPVYGRFMQEDAYWGDGFKLYVYCANNPVVYYNPSGYTKYGGNNAINTTSNIDYGSINSYGQRSGIIAETTPQMIGTGTSAKQSIKPPGWINGIPISEGGAGQARAHLLAKDLGGSGSVESNLVTF